MGEVGPWVLRPINIATVALMVGQAWSPVVRSEAAVARTGLHAWGPPIRSGGVVCAGTVQDVWGSAWLALSVCLIYIYIYIYIYISEIT
jgi:hypothetical protein